MGSEVVLNLLHYLFILFLMGSCSAPTDDGAAGSSIEQATTVDTRVFGAVTDIIATPSEMTDGSGYWQVVVSWKNPTSSSSTDLSYEIQRSEKTTAIPIKTHKQDYKNITKSPYTIANIPAGSTQYFIVIVSGIINSAKVSVTSSEYTINVPLDVYTEKPGAFTMNALATDSQAKIEWTKSERASFYVIQRGTSSKSYPTEVTRLASSPYVDKNLTNGQTYYYIVIAVNSVGSTNATDEVASTPYASLGAPGAFVLTAIAGDSKITLNWTSSDNAGKYTIFRSTISETIGFTKLTEIIAPTLSYEDSTAINNTVYYYKIVASSETPPVEINSNTVNATPTALLQDNTTALPQDFTVIALPGDGQVSLSWINSTGASSYTVQYGTNTGSYPMTVSTSASSGLVVPSLTNGIIYYFRVIAVNSRGSTNAPEISATPEKWIGVKHFGVVNAMTGIGGQQGVSSDALGNVYVTGSIYGGTLPGNTQTGTQDSYVAKFNYVGTMVWVTQFGNPGHETIAYSLATDTLGNSYVSGYSGGGFNGNPIIGARDAFIAKIDALGQFQWIKQIGAPGQYYVGFSVSCNLSGDVFVSGIGTDPAIFLRKYDRDGVLKWSYNKTMDNGFGFGGGYIKSDNLNNIYLVGTIPNAEADKSGNTSDGKLFLSKIQDQGDSFVVFGETELYGGTGTATVSAGVAIDSLGNPVVVGKTTGAIIPGHSNSGAANELIIVKYNKDTLQYFSGFQDSSFNQPSPNSISVDLQGNIYVGGSSESSGIYLLKYDGGLSSLQWTQNITGGYGYHMTLNSNGIFFAAGSNTGIYSVVPYGDFDAYVLKYNFAGELQ